MNRKKYIKKKQAIKKSLLLTTGLMLFMSNAEMALAATINVNFPLSNSQDQTKSVTLPSNFDSVTSIAVDNGDVNYAVNNGQLNVNVKNGTPVSSDSVLNPTKYSKPATTFLYSKNNDLPLTAPYNDDDGFSGTLGIDGAPEVTSGTLIPGSTKTVTDKQVSSDPNYFANTMEYNYGGFTGTLTKNGSPVKVKVDGSSFIQDKKTGTDKLTRTSGTTGPYKFKFDGSTYVQLPKSLNNFGKNDFTFEGWFDIDSDLGQGYVMLGKNAYAEHPTVDNSLLLAVYQDKYYITTGPTGSLNKFYSGNSAKKGERVHLAWVVKSNVLTFYENGVNIWTQTIPARDYYVDDRPIVLGQEFDSNTPTDFYKGAMENVRMYERALTQTEIKNNMNGSETRTNLVGEYLFNTGMGTVIYDTSGKGNHGRVIGNAKWEGTIPTPIFPSTVSYDDGNYEGTLSKSGSPKYERQIGTYIPENTKEVAQSKSNTTGVFSNTLAYNSGGYSGTLFKDKVAYVDVETKNFTTEKLIKAFDPLEPPDYKPTELGYWTRTSVVGGVKHVRVWYKQADRYSGGTYIEKTGNNCSSWLNAGGGFSDFGCTYDWWDYYYNHNATFHFDATKDGFQIKPAYITDWTWTKITRTYTQDYIGVVKKDNAKNVKEVEQVKTSTTNSFPSSIAYNDGTYSGTLTKYGSPTKTLVSGTYTSAHTKTVDGVDKHGIYKYDYYKFNGNEWAYSHTVEINGTSATMEYSKDGYTGTLKRKEYDYENHRTNPYPTSPKLGDIHLRQEYTRYYEFYGTVSRPQSDTRVYEYTQHYIGKVQKSGEVYSDGLTYEFSQNYSGNAIRYIEVTNTLGSYTNSFANSIEYVDRNGFKGTINKIGTPIVASDGQYIQEYGGRVYSQTFDNTSYEYTQYYSGTVKSPDIDTRIWRANYTGTVYKGEYEPTNQKYIYNVVVNYSVMTGSNTCSYKHISPPSTTISNYIPKCISVTKSNNDLYKMLYNFSVTGISVSGDR